jgi:large subunit ribosomal protein L4
LYLNESIFGHDVIRLDLLQRTVEYQRNQKRGQRTAKTKTIGEVRGSTKTVRQQKGTGQAQAGHSRPAHWRGSAKAHGSKGKSQDYSNCNLLNKHVRKLTLTHALSQK